MGFADGVAKSAATQLEQVNEKIVDISQELFTTVVNLTPVGLSTTRGQLINNWWVGQGIGNINRSYARSFNTSGANSRAQIASLKGSKEFEGKDGEFSFTNSVPYAYRAEYAGWPAPKWSGKVAPYAMVRNALTIISAKKK